LYVVCILMAGPFVLVWIYLGIGLERVGAWMRYVIGAR
jgi:hypothetical protein